MRYSEGVLTLLAMACGTGDADRRPPALGAIALPAAQVLADAPLVATFAVSDPDSEILSLSVQVSGLEPTDPPVLRADGTLIVALTPPVGAWTVRVEVTDPGGNATDFLISFEAVSGDADGDGAVAASFGGDDCDDLDDAIGPQAAEHCDGVDEDCDGVVDDEPVDGVTRWPDADGDGAGADGASFTTCEADLTSTDRGGDCDDTNRFAGPGVTQLGLAGCDGIGLTLEWLGEGPGDRAGDNARDAGDLDGDGLSEVLICSPEYAEAAGAVYLVTGSSAGKASLADATAKLVGEVPTSGAGFDFLAPGDLNGDGQPDLLVGAAGYDGILGNEGAVYVALGPFSGESSLGDAHARLVGSEAGDQLGDVASGDLDGDGSPEILLGARWADPNGIDSGWVLVMGLPPAGESRAADLATTRLIGERPGVIAGDPFQIGDVTGDGLDDVGILTQEDATSGPQGGAVYVLHAPLAPGDVVLTAADAKWIGSAGSLTGHFGDGAGDVSGDGISDVVIGAPYADPNGSKSGVAYVLFGPGPAGVVAIEANADAVLQGDRAGIRAGFSVSRLGDMNLDGDLDLAIGAKFDDTVGENAGAAYVVPGPFGGVTDLGVTGVKILGEAPGDLAGDVGGVADLNGDAIPDLVIGARHTAEAGVEAGSAYLVFGAAF